MHTALSDKTSKAVTGAVLSKQANRFIIVHHLPLNGAYYCSILKVYISKLPKMYILVPF